MCEIANKIKARRPELGLTLEDVAQAVGVGRSTVQRWESGLIKNMGRDKIAALAKILQISPVELVPGDGGKTDHPPEYDDPEDREFIEAMHQDPTLRMLFSKQKNLSDSDKLAVLAVVNAINKERDADG